MSETLRPARLAWEGSQPVEDCLKVQGGGASKCESQDALTHARPGTHN